MTLEALAQDRAEHQPQQLNKTQNEVITMAFEAKTGDISSELAGSISPAMTGEDLLGEIFDIHGKVSKSTPAEYVALSTAEKRFALAVQQRIIEQDKYFDASALGVLEKLLPLPDNIVCGFKHTDMLQKVSVSVLKLISARQNDEIDMEKLDARAAKALGIIDELLANGLKPAEIVPAQLMHSMKSLNYNKGYVMNVQLKVVPEDADAKTKAIFSGLKSLYATLMPNCFW